MRMTAFRPAARTVLRAAFLFCLAGNMSAGLAQPVVAEDRVPVAELPRHTHIHGLAVDRSDPSRLFIATHHGFFVATPDGMATRISPVQDFMGFTPHPSDPFVLYASGHPAGGGNLGFIRSSDGGATWMQLSQGAGGPVDFHQMDVSPTDPDTIYGAFGGIQVSRNSGGSWAAVGTEPEGLIDLAASAYVPGRLYAATRIGLWVSDDEGASWREAAFGPDIATMIRTDAAGRLFLFVGGKGLYRGVESDLAQWTLLDDRFGDRAILHLAIDPGDANRMFAATQASEILRSEDGGRSWAPF